MFEFGRDLRKLFVQARESEDLSWLELIGVDLLAVEARDQTTDAGRVSCPDPSRAARRASALWREHARRSGDPTSLAKAVAMAEESRRTARSGDAASRAALAAAEALMLRFDLFGGAHHLDAALACLPLDPRPSRQDAACALVATVARIHARQARLGEDASAIDGALRGLDAAMAAQRRASDPERDALALERAALALDLGIQRRDPARLDEAGRALQALVATASPDYRPVTRARALTLCAAGLCALAALADNREAAEQGRILFEAAAEQFTPDHSPLDWVAVQVARGTTAAGADRDAIGKAVALADRNGLVLGAVAREVAVARAVGIALSLHDVVALSRLEAELHRRLSRGGSPLDWAVDQIALARVVLALASIAPGSGARDLHMALVEAEITAREQGVPMLAQNARDLLTTLRQPA